MNFELLFFDTYIPWFVGLSVSSLFAYFYTDYVKSRYEKACLPGSRIRARIYQWRSREAWEESFRMLSELFLKIVVVFLPMSVLVLISWLLFNSWRFYISMVATLFLLIELVVLVVKIIKIHKSFCKKGWLWKYYNNSKTLKKIDDNAILKNTLEEGNYE